MFSFWKKRKAEPQPAAEPTPAVAPEAAQAPAPAAIPVVRGRTRAHLLLKCASRPPLRAAARALLAGGHLRRRGGVHTILDVDPRSFM